MYCTQVGMLTPQPRRYMCSAGQDKNLGVWDLRMMKEVNSYFLRQPGSSISISDRDLVGVGWGTQTSIWKGLFNKHRNDQEKVQAPYMGWGGEGRVIEQVKWCPFEEYVYLMLFPPK